MREAKEVMTDSDSGTSKGNFPGSIRSDVETAGSSPDEASNLQETAGEIERLNNYILGELTKSYSKIDKKVDDKLSKLDKEVAEKLKKVGEDISKNTQEISKQSYKNIEIIGIFSAVISFIIIDVNIIKSADTFLSAVFLIIGLGAVLLIFAGAISYLLPRSVRSKDEKKGNSNGDNAKRNTVICGAIVLGILLGLAVTDKALSWHLFSADYGAVESRVEHDLPDSGEQVTIEKSSSDLGNDFSTDADKD